MAVSPNCHIIAILGGKGGVGKSVFATNFAITLQLETRQPCLLIDFDSKSAGDLNLLLNAKTPKTIQEFSSLKEPVHQGNLFQHVYRHNSGLAYLAAVKTPMENLSIASDAVATSLDSLSLFFNYIILDLGSDLNPVQLQALQASTVGLVLTTPEILTINQTQRLLNELMTHAFPGDMFHLVVNKINRSSLSSNSISQSLRLPIVGQIPQDDNIVMNSLQSGTPFIPQGATTPLGQGYVDCARRLNGGIIQKLKLNQKQRPAPSPIITKQLENQKNSPLKAVIKKESDPINVMKLQVHRELLEAMDLKKGITDTQGNNEKEKALQQKTTQVISQIVDKRFSHVGRDERSRMIKEVLDEALGLGPLEDLLADPTVNEIMVNGHDKIFIEKNRKMVLSPVTFTSNLQLRNVIERIVTPIGRRIDEKTPYVDARLPDGSRVNAVIEPVSLDGPSLTIRKFAKDQISGEDLVKFGTLTKPMLDFLRICGENRLNIVISGGTGSGKTTLLNVLSSFIPHNERVVTIEDAAELQLRQEHVVRLETRPANMEGSGAITIRDLVRNSLRMRPDRIVVGECRDGAAMDMLSAMNTGHDGSMTTIHANNPREALSRLETLCLMSGMELPVRAIRDQMASAVQLLVQIRKFSDGTRKLTSITEVVGIQNETITTQEIFRFKEEGFDKNRKVIGNYLATGMIPTFIEKFEQKGVSIPRNLFANNKDADKNENKAVKPLNVPIIPNLKRTGSGGSKT